MRWSLVLLLLALMSVGCGVAFEGGEGGNADVPATSSTGAGGVGASGAGGAGGAMGGMGPAGMGGMPLGGMGGIGGAAGGGGMGGCSVAFSSSFNNFDGWDVLTSGGGTVSNNNNEVALFSSGDTANVETMAVNELDACGVQVHASFIETDGAKLSYLFVAYVSDPNDRVAWAVQGTQLQARIVTDNTVTAYVEASYDPVAHAWWRIQHIGPDIVWSTSADGLTWSTFHSASAPSFATGGSKTRLGVRNIGNEVDARFDDFTIFSEP